jgi:methionyl-tRNA formyltransferase
MITTARTLVAVGDRSPIGRAVLEHALDRFDVQAVLFPTEETYDRFLRAVPEKPAVRPTLRERLRKIKSYVVPPRQPGFDQAVRLSWDEVCETWVEGEFDLMLSGGFPAIFPDRVLGRADLSVNVHTSLLPQLKGRHPHYWAIEWGLERSGLTAHEMTSDVDEGNVVGQVVVDIPGGTSYVRHYADLQGAVPGLLDQVQRWFETGDRVEPVAVEASWSPGEA